MLIPCTLVVNSSSAPMKHPTWSFSSDDLLSADSYFLVQVNDTKRYNKAKADELFKKFDVLKSIELVHFQPFADTADAVAAITASQEGKITDRLSQFLERAKDSAIAVAEKNLAVSLKDTIDGVIHDDKTQELFRGIREHLPELLESSLSESDLKSMQLGLSHALGRYKLKFSADKVDTMVIQGIGLLDDLDKEVNIYGMRVKEWYGWHFPELQAIVSDNVAYSTLVTKVGERRGFQNADLTGVFDDDDEAMISAVREAADVSMGTDVTELEYVLVAVVVAVDCNARIA
jgi:nucleolar protein 58